jgi:HEAT repeat protein
VAVRPARIWAQCIGVMLIYAGLTILVERSLSGMASRELTLVVAFLLVQAASIIVMLFVLLARRGAAQRRARLSQPRVEAAQAAIAEHVTGRDALRTLRRLQKESRRDVATAVAMFVSVARGTARDRVLRLARELGIRRDELAIEYTIEELAQAPLAVRAIASERMRPRADELARTVIPGAIASQDEKVVAAAVELLAAWKRFVPVEGYERALTHPSGVVRARAFAALPYVLEAREEWLERGLADSSFEVRAAAAQAAGVMRASSALPLLEATMNGTNHDAAVSAAFAIATTPAGLDVLRRSHLPVALEALEKASLGRLEL